MGVGVAWIGFDDFFEVLPLCLHPFVFGIGPFMVFSNEDIEGIEE